MTKHEQVNELIDVYGFRQKSVEGWSEDRLTTVLAARRRDARLALKRADNMAALIEGTSLSQPSTLERMAAATYLEETMTEGGHAIVNAVLYVGHCLTDDEAKSLAAELIAMFRAAGWGSANDATT